MKKLSEIISVGKLVGSRGGMFRKTSTSKPDDWRDRSGKDVGAMRNAAHERAAVNKADASRQEREAKVEKRTKEAEQRAKETLKMAKEDLVEAKGKFVYDKPLKAHVDAMEKKDTSDLKGMHDRWAGDHKDMKSNPAHSERLLAVHHVLRKRGVNVPDLPQHKNLGMVRRFTSEAVEPSGTEARTKIKNVARPDDASPTSEKSLLSKTGEIKVKKVDEEIASSISRKYGLSDSMLEAARSILEKKTQVDLDPETDDKIDDGNDDDDDDVKKESKHTTPKSDKEKKLAALAHPKDKITHKDVLVGRGVLKKEETEIEEKTLYGNPAELKRQLDQVAKREKALPPGISPARKALAIQKQKLQKAHSASMGIKKEDVDSLTEEQLEEVLKKSQPAGEWIKDFVHSKDPKFAGKSKKERMKMALGAYYAKQRNEEVEEVDEAIKPYVSYTAGGMGKSPSATVMAANEKPHKTFTKAEHGHDYKQKAMDYFKKHGNKLKEEEQLDELSPATLKSYEKGAKKDVKHARDDIAYQNRMYKDFGARPDVRDSQKTIAKRTKGIELAKAKTNLSGRSGITRATIAAREEVEFSFTEEEIERLEAIAAQLDEAKPTVVSAPIRGANQDQSGFGIKRDVADYTISDSKKVKVKEETELAETYTLKLKKTTHPKDVTDDEDQPVKATEKHYDIHRGDKKVGEVVHHHNEYGGHFYDGHINGKRIPYDRHNGPGEGAKAFIDGVAKTKWHAKTVKEEVELDEASPMAAPPKNRYDSAEEAKAAAKKAREAGKTVKVLKHTFTHPRTGEQTHSYSVKEEVEIDEARGRPKKSGEAADGDDTHKHPIQQLNKIAASIQGNEPHFEHKDGSKTKISKQVAKHVSSIYGGLRTSQEKDDFAKGLHASRESFKSTVSKHAR